MSAMALLDCATADTTPFSKETLTETIQNWEYFRADALYRLNDHRMNPDDWESATRSIEIAIDKLREKLSWVQKKSEEVRDLRDGVSGLSLLDTSHLTKLALRRIFPVRQSHYSSSRR